MTPEQLKEARRNLGLSASAMARALSDPDKPPRIGDPGKAAGQVDPRTIRRWEDGTQDIPGPVVAAVTLMMDGRHG